MKITGVETTPLLVPYPKPYHWAQGVTLGACVVLVEVTTDEGITGYGECIATPAAAPIISYLQLAAASCIDRSPFDNALIMKDIYHKFFQANANCSAPRYAGMLLAGLEMAMWDACGKITEQPVHALLGGKLRNEIDYFGFAQGESAEELAAHARQLADEGCKVIYVKVGRGEILDQEIVSSVRQAIGPQLRLRIDPNEHWDPQTARRMINRLSQYDIDFVEQPTHCESISALAQVRSSSPVAIAADQCVFTPHDVYDVVREKAADLIVLGLHETGGIRRFQQCAAIADAAGINICIHGLHETGITTCATNQAAATINNLDDGNQYMNHLLAWDILESPGLALDCGRLPALDGAGLGFRLDHDAIARAHENFKQANLP